MFNTIRLKILAVATALLTVFAITTGFSTYLNREVVEEMQAITEYHIPLGAHVSSIDVLTFELEVQIRRSISKVPLSAEQVAALRQRHGQIVKKLRDDISIVKTSLEAGIADPRNDLEDRIAMAELKGSFSFL